MKWRTSSNRRSHAAQNSHGIRQSLRGRWGPISFLAIAGVLGVASGFALAAPSSPNISSAPQVCTGTSVATRIESPSSGETTSVQVIGGATLTFVFDNSAGGPYQATWTADAPFTGTIVVKAGSGNSNGE